MKTYISLSSKQGLTIALMSYQQAPAYPKIRLWGLGSPSLIGFPSIISCGNNVVPLRSDTIQLVQNRCSFHELRSEDPNQHLKDFLKLVDSLDHDGENKERTPAIHHHVGGSYYPIPCSILSTGKDRKTPQRYPDVPTTSWRICPSPQPQALETIFEARIRDYMAAHTERMERFENAIFKQREGINSRTHD
ncbi:hypothetical protein Tco_1205175 [Tanacetum coccineum]